MGHGWFRVGNPPFLLRLTFSEMPMKMSKKKNWSDIINSRYEKLQGDKLSKMSVSEILEIEEIPEFGELGMLHFSEEGMSDNDRYVDEWNPFVEEY